MFQTLEWGSEIPKQITILMFMTFIICQLTIQLLLISLIFKYNSKDFSSLVHFGSSFIIIYSSILFSIHCPTIQ